MALRTTPENPFVHEDFWPAGHSCKEILVLIRISGHPDLFHRNPQAHKDSRWISGPARKILNLVRII